MKIKNKFKKISRKINWKKILILIFAIFAVYCFFQSILYFTGNISEKVNMKFKYIASPFGLVYVNLETNDEFMAGNPILVNIYIPTDKNVGEVKLYFVGSNFSSDYNLYKDINKINLSDLSSENINQIQPVLNKSIENLKNEYISLNFFKGNNFDYYETKTNILYETGGDYDIVLLVENSSSQILTDSINGKIHISYHNIKHTIRTNKLLLGIGWSTLGIAILTLIISFLSVKKVK